VTALQGQIDVNVDLDLVLDLDNVSHTFEQTVLGAQYSIGGTFVFGYVNLEAAASGSNGLSAGFSDDDFNISDPALVPLQLKWSDGDFHYMLSQSVIPPIGDYDVNEQVNLGRNYWSFNTVGALTWFNAESGWEVSVAPGVMFNTRNTDTDYETGTEFHVDFMINHFLTKTFVAGVKGYYYRQLTADSGDGATLGDFKSRSAGIGPGFLWTPAFAEGRLSILGKFMVDFDSENRFDSQYGMVTVAWIF
jgi:hypothetical protein